LPYNYPSGSSKTSSFTDLSSLGFRTGKPDKDDWGPMVSRGIH
jgi:hypothetical protein